MNSFLNDIGIDPGFIIIALGIIVLALLIMVIMLMFKYAKIQRSYEAFMEWRNSKSLEEILIKVVEDNKKVKQQCKNNIDAIIDMKKKIKASYQKIGLLKYDSFRGMAGKLSFSIALLDGENSGFVLNCMHTQDGCYNYMKEIIHGEPLSVLSEEEKEVLEIAIQCEKMSD